MSATAVRGGRSSGVLEVEHAGGTALIPPPPPPQMDREKGERCFRSRAREYKYLLKDRAPVVTPTGDTIPGSRQWLEFRPHASGLFGQIVTADPAKLQILECLAGIRCPNPEHVDKEGKFRLMSVCRQLELPCKGLELDGEIWEADGEVEEYDTQRAQQMLQELKERPALREKLRSLGDAQELFQLGEPQRPARKPPKDKNPAEPPKGEASASGQTPEGGFNLTEE